MLHLSQVRLNISAISLYNSKIHNVQIVAHCALTVLLSRGILCGWTPAVRWRLGRRSGWQTLDNFAWSMMKERYKPPQVSAFINECKLSAESRQLFHYTRTGAQDQQEDAGRHPAHAPHLSEGCGWHDQARWSRRGRAPQEPAGATQGRPHLCRFLFSGFTLSHLVLWRP